MQITQEHPPAAPPRERTGSDQTRRSSIDRSNLARVFGAAFFVASVTNACFPSPRHQVETPGFMGVVTRGGAPVANTTVVLSERYEDFTCVESSAQTQTDESGRFHLPAIVRFRLFRALIGDPLFSWNLCIFVDGARLHGYTGAGLGQVEPIPIAMSCDLDAPLRGVKPTCAVTEAWRLDTAN